MLFILHTETDKLCLKDLSSDVTNELILRLLADGAAMEKFNQFFGLKMGHRYRPTGIDLTDIKELFPNTALNMLKECFEALRLYDLSELLEKVKPRSLRPALSSEQIGKLRNADARPPKYHSNVAVLIVNNSGKGDIVGKEDAEKIETFFKDLNSRNEVMITPLATPQETCGFLWELKERKRGMRYYHWKEGSYKKDLESVLQRKARLEKELEGAMQMKKGREQRRRQELELRQLKQQELRCRCELENIVQAKNQAKRVIEKLQELENKLEKSTNPVSTAMDELIHNQGWFTSYTYSHVYLKKFESGVLIKLS